MKVSKRKIFKRKRKTKTKRKKKRKSRRKQGGVIHWSRWTLKPQEGWNPEDENQKSMLREGAFISFDPGWGRRAGLREGRIAAHEIDSTGKQWIFLKTRGDPRGPDLTLLPGTHAVKYELQRIQAIRTPIQLISGLNIPVTETDVNAVTGANTVAADDFQGPPPSGGGRRKRTRRRRRQRKRTRRRRGGIPRQKKMFYLKELDRVWKERGGKQSTRLGCINTSKKWNKLTRHTGRRLRHPFIYKNLKRCHKKYVKLFKELFPFRDLHYKQQRLEQN